MLQKLPINGFECVEDISAFDESFLKVYNEESDEVYFLEVNVHNKTEIIIHIKKFNASFKPWASVKKGTKSD